MDQDTRDLRGTEADIVVSTKPLQGLECARENLDLSGCSVDRIRYDVDPVTAAVLHSLDVLQTLGDHRVLAVPVGELR